MSLLTKKSTFKLQSAAIKYFQKLPITIQAEIVEKACVDVGWDTSFVIDIPEWANAENKTVRYDIKSYYTNNINTNSYGNVLSNFGNKLSIHTGHTIIDSCVVENGISVPHGVMMVEKTHSYKKYNNKLKVYLNKFLKQKLPKILIDDYPEYII